MTEQFPGLPPPIGSRPPRGRRRTGLRIAVFALVGVLALVGVSFIGLLVWAWRNVDRQERAEAEGVAFASHATDAGCLDETLRRVRVGDSWLRLHDAAFLRGCLEGAEPSSGFCAGVPLPSDQEGGLEWRLARCEAAELGLDEGNCSSLLWPVQTYCVEQRAVREGSAPAETRRGTEESAGTAGGSPRPTSAR